MGGLPSLYLPPSHSPTHNPPTLTTPPHFTPTPPQVLMSHDGRLLVTMSKDCTSRVWDATTGQCMLVLQGEGGEGGGG